MEWKHYWRNVVKRYSILVEGWPSDIPFSLDGRTLGDLETLRHKWQTGTIYWKTLSAAELNQLDQERNEQIEAGEISDPKPRRPRSDRGKKRKRAVPSADNSEPESTNDQSEHVPLPRTARKRRKVINKSTIQVPDFNDDLDDEDYEENFGAARASDDATE